MTPRQQWFVAAVFFAVLAVIALILLPTPPAARVHFNSCAEASQAGAPLPLHEGDPGWNPRLDPDHNGEAC